MLAKSLWHINQNQSEIKSHEISSTRVDGENEKILIYSMYSLISLGTERLVSLGRVPLNLNDKMRVPYMGGDFSMPVKYGYSLIGKDSNGTTFHMMHPHQDLAFINKNHLTLVPDHIPPQRATLISNLETALNAYWDAEPKSDENILIAGFGLIGALIANLLRLKGHHNIFIIEKDADRSLYAKNLGFNVVPTLDIKPTFELAFHSSASEHGLQLCINHMSHEGRIIELSWYGDRGVSLELGSSFHYKRLSIQSSQVSSIPIKMRDHYTFESRKQEVIKLLLDPSWDLLLNTEIPFEESPVCFDKIRSGSMAALSVIIKY